MQPSEFLIRLCAPEAATADLPPAAVVTAHPDDEVIGLGSRLPRMGAATFVHVTDGSPADLHDARNSGCNTREEYAALRRRERLAALVRTGIGPERTREMGCPDQQASLHMADLACATAALLWEMDVPFVFTHPYEGGHPDHDATAFLVHAAVRLMERNGGPAPRVLEMTSYFLRDGSITPFEFLPGTGEKPVTVVLTEEERALKRDLLACYPSQRETLQYFPVEVERFRPAPRYDFTRPPHAGMLFYECFDWGMTGHRFRALAREALDALGLEGPL